ncbi:hypothetical protein [Chitinibacter tainanensis]|nr:hypothetical protein [Chitinibacter tainanensis]
MEKLNKNRQIVNPLTSESINMSPSRQHHADHPFFTLSAALGGIDFAK